MKDQASGELAALRTARQTLGNLSPQGWVRFFELQWPSKSQRHQMVAARREKTKKVHDDRHHPVRRG